MNLIAGLPANRNKAKLNLAPHKSHQLLSLSHLLFLRKPCQPPIGAFSFSTHLASLVDFRPNHLSDSLVGNPIREEKCSEWCFEKIKKILSSSFLP